MMQKKIKSPILSRNKKDPTQSYKLLNKTYRNLEKRYYNIKLNIKNLFDLYLVGREKVSNVTFIFREGVIYQTNSNYIYDMSAEQLKTLLKHAQQILDDYLLEGGEDNLWILQAISDEYKRGTHSAFNNLSNQSSYYAEQTTFTALLSRTAYQNQIAQAFTLAFTDWKTLTELAKADLSNVLASAISRGINPRETARIISKRLDVSLSKAKLLAQTEQLAAYRQAQWNETDWTNERLGLRTGLLHQSALLTTSRLSHVYWHGKIRTVEDVKEWYSEDGNRYNCHCSQIPVLLSENGEPYNKAAIDRLSKESSEWIKERDTK